MLCSDNNLLLIFNFEWSFFLWILINENYTENKNIKKIHCQSLCLHTNVNVSVVGWEMLAKFLVKSINY